MPSSSKKADEEYQPPDPKDQTPQGLKEQAAADQEVNVRRSSRANKGVARPIFDPSDLPSESGGYGNRSLSKKEVDPIVFDLDSDESEEFDDNLELSKLAKKKKPYKPRVSKGKKETVSKAVVETKVTEVTESTPAPLEDSFSDEDDLPLTILKAANPASTTKSTAKSTSTTKSTTKKRKKKEQEVEEFPATSSSIPSLELSPYKAQFGKLPAKEEEDSEEIDEERLLPTEKLQCICKKTHTNRLLVLCDKCDCWLHGDCVGLSTQRARNIEDKGEIYTCPNCSPAQRKISSSEMPRDSQSGKSTGGFSMKGYALKGTITNPSSSSEAQLNVAADKKRIKFYRIPKKKKKVIKKPVKREMKKGVEGSKRSARLRKGETNNSNNNNETTKSTSSGESSRRKCTVPTCNKDALPGTVYCSNTCILEHARLSSHHLKQPSATASSEVIKPKYSVPKNESSSNKHQLEPQMLISPPPPQVSPKKRLKDNKIMVRSRKTGKVIGRVVFDKEEEEYPPRKVQKRRSSSGGEDFIEAAPPSTSSSSRNSSSGGGGSGVVKRKKMKKPESAAPPKAAPAPPRLDKQPGVFDFINHHVMKRERVNRMRMAHDQAPIPAASKIIRKAEKRVSGSSSKEMGGKSHKKAKLTFEEQLLNTSAQAVTAQRKIAKQQKMEKLKKAKAREQKARMMESGSSGKVAGHKSVTTAVEKRTAPSTSHDSRQQHRPITTSDSVKPARLDSVRGNVRKTLNDILKNRSASTKELRMHPNSIQRLADKIEDSLYKVYNDTNIKYKNKYRSIMFNLKDEKNPGLWRKVIIGEVTSAELVQMTPEQMASRKLAEWRQQKMEEELDIIQKQEKERANVRPIAKITHKGEIAIQEDLSDMIHNVSTTTDATKEGNTTVDGGKEETPDLSNTIDTTSDHRNHLFDLHCSICTGGMKEEDIENQEEQPPTVVKSSTSIIRCSESQTRSESGSSEQGITVEKKTSVETTSDEKEMDEVFGGGETPTMDEIGSPINMPDSPVNMPESPDSEMRLDEEMNEKPRTAIVYEQVAAKPLVQPVVTLPTTSFVSFPAAVRPTPEDVIWRGTVSMNELPSFTSNVYPVCGDCSELNLHLPISLEIGGRIVQSVAWKYLKDVKVTRSKQISVVRFHAASAPETKAYINMMGYFSKRKRFGVLGNPDRTILKDMYLIPVMHGQPMPSELIELTDGEITEHLPTQYSLIIGVIVRNRTKSYRDMEVSSPNIKTSPRRPAATSSPNILENTTKSKVLSLIDSVRQMPPSSVAQQEQYSPTKQSGVTIKRTAGQGYIPSTIATTVPSNEDLDTAYDPEEEEEYDPETAFSSTVDVPQNKEADDRPYDPEEDEERLMTAGINEAEAERRRNELLAEIRREIDAKAAKLAQVNKEMKISEDVVEAEGTEAPNDPRLARRSSTETPQATGVSDNPLQTILSALKIPPSTTGQQEVVAMDTSSPPQLPDSTTKSDPEEIGEPFVVTKQTSQTRVIDNEEDEDSADFRSGRRTSGDVDMRSSSSSRRNHRDHSDQRRQDHRNNHHHRSSYKRNRSRSRSPGYRRRNNDHHNNSRSSRRDGDRHQSRDRGRY